MSTPPVNTDRLIESFGADFKFLNDIYTAYLVDSGERIKLLKGHVAAEQVDACGHSAHALKGASVNIGADTLATLAGELELMARSGDLSKGPAMMNEITPEFESVRTFLIGYLDSIRP
ncbi:MAG: Hpt domain-containing protein [Candidatus Hydrogenedentota bacterium]